MSVEHITTGGRAVAAGVFLICSYFATHGDGERWLFGFGAVLAFLVALS